MYGAQADWVLTMNYSPFENDVEMYGAQALPVSRVPLYKFENDVEMYGAQASLRSAICSHGLRMM